MQINTLHTKLFFFTLHCSPLISETGHEMQGMQCYVQLNGGFKTFLYGSTQQHYHLIMDPILLKCPHN